MPQSSAGMPMLVNSLQTPSLAPCWHRAAEPQIDIQPHRHKLHRWLRACHPCTPAGYLPTRTQPQQSTPWSLPGMQRDDSKSSSQKQHSFLLFIKLLEMLNCPFFFFFLLIKKKIIIKNLLRLGFCYGFFSSAFIDVRFSMKIIFDDSVDL